MRTNIIQQLNEYKQIINSTKYNVYGRRIDYNHADITSLRDEIEAFLKQTQDTSIKGLMFESFVEKILELAIAIIGTINNCYKDTVIALKQLNSFYKDVKTKVEQNDQAVLPQDDTINQSFNNLKTFLQNSSKDRAYTYQGYPLLQFIQAPKALNAHESLAKKEAIILENIKAALQELELIKRPDITMIKSAYR